MPYTTKAHCIWKHLIDGPWPMSIRLLFDVAFRTTQASQPTTDLGAIATSRLGNRLAAVGMHKLTVTSFKRKLHYYML